MGKDRNGFGENQRRKGSKWLWGKSKKERTTGDGDQREFDLETRVIANGDNKTPRCFTVVH